MSTVIYLANQQIQIVTGTPGEHKVNVQRNYVFDAPEGSLINGMIMDTELFIGFMKDVWAQNKLPVKDVSLVVNSSKFVGKIIEVPKLNDKKLFEFIDREYADSNRGEKKLYSYIPLGVGEGKMLRIYAESIDPDFIGDYISIFDEIGIKLKGVSSGESSLIGLTSMTTAKAYKTFSLIIADSLNLTNILWLNGSFYYFNSMRCFHEQGSEDYAGDVARSVSQTIQFMQAHQVEQNLECVVIAGIEQADLPMYRRAIDQMGILTPVQIFEASTLVPSQQVDIQKCLRAASGLVISGKWVNLLNQYNSFAKKSNIKENKSGINVLPIGISAAVMIVLLLFSWVIQFAKQHELKKIQEYNESPEVIFGVTTYNILVQKNNFLSAQEKAIEDLEEDLQTYPICDSSIVNQIEKCASGYAEVSFDSFKASEGSIDMTASADSVDNINKFIKKLIENDIFNSVDYTGYSFNESTGLWDIHVTCVLAESAGR